MKKILIVSVLLLLLGGIGVGLFMFYKPHKDIAGSKSDIVVTDAEVFKAFEINEQEAIKKYVSGDPIIELSGKISEISNSADTAATVVIQDTTQYHGNVTCAIVKNEITKLKAAKAGDQITIKGQCSGMQELIDKEVIFLRCVVVK